MVVRGIKPWVYGEHRPADQENRREAQRAFDKAPPEPRIEGKPRQNRERRVLRQPQKAERDPAEQQPARPAVLHLAARAVEEEHPEERENRAVDQDLRRRRDARGRDREKKSRENRRAP